MPWMALTVRPMSLWEFLPHADFFPRDDIHRVASPLKEWASDVSALPCPRPQPFVSLHLAPSERAVKCSVCQAAFSIPPPQASVGVRITSFLRGAGGAVCLSLLAFGLSGEHPLANRLPVTDSHNPSSAAVVVRECSPTANFAFCSHPGPE